MLYREVIKLISITYTTNGIGDPIETKVTKTVFADKRPIRQSEHYQAMALGIRPELMFVVRTVEYDNQIKLEYDGKEYNIIRVYDKDGEHMELICQSLVNRGE